MRIGGTIVLVEDPEEKNFSLGPVCPIVILFTFLFIFYSFSISFFINFLLPFYLFYIYFFNLFKFIIILFIFVRSIDITFNF